MNVYWILCCIRVLLVFLPQTGYIHPDEHFQGPEIVYGDILQLKVHKTWEFASEKPIRNVVYPYLVAGLPSLVANLLKSELWGTTSYPYLLLVLPRVIMCAFSFIHDLLLYKVCLLTKKNHKPCLIAFASSYVTLVYLTRTFSNSLESLFFSFVIFLMCKLLRVKEVSRDATQSVAAERSRVNLCYMLGLVLGVGVFNRPTFLCYAVYPTMAFVVLLFGMRITIKSLFVYLISFCLGGLSILLSFTAMDSLYYKEAHFSSPRKDLLKNVVFTPMNFILYNMDLSNLGNHGLHSRWLHLCVNLPLLFSIYSVSTLVKFFRSGRNLYKPSHLGFENFLLLSFVTPLFLLSLIPHQEPRFIIPSLFPLVLTLDDSNCDDYYVTRGLMRKLWYAHNVLAVLFFGFLHQGGIYTSSSHIHSIIQKDTRTAVVYYKTYMPPRHLLGLDASMKDVQIYDFAGIDLRTLDSYLGKMTMVSRPRILFAVVPHEIVNRIVELPSVMSNYKISARKFIFPHLSTESLPDLKKMRMSIRSKSSVVGKLLEIKKTLSIHILTFKSIL